MIRRILVLLAFAAAAAAQTPSVAGDWQTTFVQLSGARYFLLHLEQSGDKVTGTLAGGIKIDGTFRNGTLDLIMHEEGRPQGHMTAKVQGNEITAGTGQDDDGTITFTAHRPVVATGAPRTHQFTPTQFHNYFSSKIAPALHLMPGDTVDTRSVDAGGTDENGKRRALGGNPLTGPFYIEGAFPGDTLVVKLNRVRLNRDSAISSGQIVPNALAPGYNRNAKYDDKFDSDWKIDRSAGVASLKNPTSRLKNFTVPLKPMLGCIGVAPPQEQSYRSGFLGNYGGNMDYNQFGEGVTLYLPVFHPGALLFLGDAHAAQGDGELTGNALETSMEFSFTVELIKGKNVPGPRAENAQYRMASGIANSLPEALQQATTSLARWLEDDYKLTANEAAVVLGSSIKYDIAEVVDPLVHIVAKIDKSALARIQQ